MNKLMEAGRNGQTDADMLSLSMSCNVDSNKTYTTTTTTTSRGIRKWKEGTKQTGVVV